MEALLRGISLDFLRKMNEYAFCMFDIYLAQYDTQWSNTVIRPLKAAFLLNNARHGSSGIDEILWFLLSQRTF